MSAARTPSIALVRHGETDWNLARRIQGRTDIPLNDTGRAQAAATAARLAAHGGWTGALSSPLARALETAEIIADGLGIAPPLIDDGLWERGFGDAEGLLYTDAVARWPGLRDVPQSEPVERVGDRGAAAVRRLLATAPGSVVVSHGSLLRSTLRALTGRLIPRIENGAVWLLSGAPDDAELEVRPLERSGSEILDPR